MRSNLFRWATAVGALKRMTDFRQILMDKPSYFERLRFVNDVLGPNWVFRLVDTIGLETIKTNRSSWRDFYVDDSDGLHLPLDPGAPEVMKYLDESYSVMDLAFYAGMGFDGYQLALQTQRDIDLVQKTIKFDNRYLLTLTAVQMEELAAYEKQKHIPKQDYYAAYGSTLDMLYSHLSYLESASHAEGEINDGDIERAAAGAIIFLCGGHQGCDKHPNKEIEFQVQMLSLVVFMIARRVMTETGYLRECRIVQTDAVTV